MAIIRNTLYPDTHENTALEYEWDDSVPVEQRVHTPVAAKVRGIEQAPGQVVAAWNKIIGENRKSGEAIRDAIASVAPGLQKQADEFEKSVAEDGTITLRVLGLTQQQTNAMKQALQGKYGATVVLVTK